MSTSNEQQNDIWWAEGDTPVRNDSRVSYLVDARSTLLTMCRHFLTARDYIYIACWGITPTMKLVRGRDHRAGPDGSDEQEALLAELRAEGLQEAEIDFWCSQKLTVEAVLGHAVSKGVEVKALIWACPELFSHYHPKVAEKQLSEVGVTCILDDSSHGILHHPVESLHQKIVVVDGTHAFVGGIDMLIELSGDFDRWDTHIHQLSSPLRSNEVDDSPHPWHDAHAVIEGPAVGDVEGNFRQRWNDVVERHELNSHLMIPEHPLPSPLTSNSQVQVARTIPGHTYSFAPKTGIQGIAQLYVQALSNAQRFIYLENQYFWTHAMYGIDLSFLGTDSPDMELNLQELEAALRRGVTVVIVLPDHPNMGRAFTDAALNRLRQSVPEAVQEGRLQVFCLAASTTVDGDELYRPIYVHAKVAIIDDLWSTVGSANLNNRGMRDDTEMNVATLDAELAVGLRMMLLAEHVGLMSEEDLLTVSRHLGSQRQAQSADQRAVTLIRQFLATIDDPLKGLRMMIECAQENLRRFKEKHPLVGHLLPYLTAEDAKQHGLHFREAHGWVELAE
jgi:phosphatidylserine/phosphatidylglycerophosphate/cardiolipin synthase-like enzyme